MKNNKGKISVTVILVIIIVLLVILFGGYILKNKSEDKKEGQSTGDTKIEVESGKITVKTSQGTSEITKDNVAELYGKEVTNYTQNGKKYRVFFIDFDGKYGDEGTVYLIADYEQKDIKLGSYKTYESNDLSVMKKMNPQWTQAKGQISMKNEFITSWLCNTKEWKDYANENANYAIGGPSIEMYVDSYKQAVGATRYKTRTVEAGYEFSSNDGNNWYQSAKNSFTEDNNSIYLTKDGTFWIASPSAGDENCLYAASQESSGIVSEGYGQSYGFRPIVSLKNTFKIETK